MAILEHIEHLTAAWPLPPPAHTNPLRQEKYVNISGGSLLVYASPDHQGYKSLHCNIEKTSFVQGSTSVYF